MTDAQEARLLRRLKALLAPLAPGKEGLTVREAAEVSGIGERELRRRIDAGLIPVVRVGRRIVIPRRRLVEHLESQAASMVEHRRQAC